MSSCAGTKWTATRIVRYEDRPAPLLELSSDAVGPLPVKDTEYLSNQDWELEPEELARLLFRLSDVLTVSGNGGEDLLGLDLTHGVPASKSHALARWHEEPFAPMLNKNFWGLMGAWIGGPVEDVDPAD